MVSSRRTYLVDTTFILKQTADAFHGAPMLVVDGKDHTFVYGFLRLLLLTRYALGVTRGILVVGAESHAAANGADVTAVVKFTKVLGIPVVHEPRRSVLDICNELSNKATHLISSETKLIQLTTQHLSIIRPKARNAYECLTSACVPSQVGVTPAQIPTFLALHNTVKACKKTGTLTKRQAIRLVELYGGLENIYANLEEIKARKGPVIAVVSKGDDRVSELADEVIELPACPDFLNPIVASIPLQLLAYHIACFRGCDVDKPRNLAKSVTVE